MKLVKVVTEFLSWLVCSLLQLVSYCPTVTPAQFSWGRNLLAYNEAWACEVTGNGGWEPVRLRWQGHLQNRARLEIFLVHPLRLTDFQDLSVAQVLQFALELVQGARLCCKSSHDLLLHHLHYLQIKEDQYFFEGWPGLVRKYNANFYGSFPDLHTLTDKIWMCCTKYPTTTRPFYFSLVLLEP